MYVKNNMELLLADIEVYFKIYFSLPFYLHFFLIYHFLFDSMKIIISVERGYSSFM